MKGRCFAGAGWTAYEDKAIRLCDGGDKVVVVSCCKTYFIQRKRLTGREYTHDHIFNTPLGRNGCYPEFNVGAAVFFEFDLTVLGLASLHNIKIGHDLYT